MIVICVCCCVCVYTSMCIPVSYHIASTTAPADIAMSVRDLGASYLGGVSLQALANAGLVEERTPGSVHRAAVAFGWPVAPGIPDNF